MPDRLRMTNGRVLTPGQQITVRRRRRFRQLTFRTGVDTPHGQVAVGEDRRGRLHYVDPDRITHVEPVTR